MQIILSVVAIVVSLVSIMSNGYLVQKKAETIATSNSGLEILGAPSLFYQRGIVASASSSFAGPFSVSNLTSCDTIDTNANGLMTCGNDGGGAGSSVNDLAAIRAYSGWEGLPNGQFVVRLNTSTHAVKIGPGTQNEQVALTVIASSTATVGLEILATSSQASDLLRILASDASEIFAVEKDGRLQINTGAAGSVQLRIGSDVNFYDIGRDNNSGALVFNGNQLANVDYIFINGQFGINSTTPGSSLSVNGDITATGTLQMYNAGTESELSFDHFGIASSSVNNVGLVYIDSSGNINSSGTLFRMTATNAVVSSTFLVAGRNANVSSSLYVGSLANCNTIDTNGDGLLACGTDEGGGGSVFTSDIYVNVGGVTSYLGASGFQINTSTAFASGTLNITSDGSIMSSGSIIDMNALGSTVSSSFGVFGKNANVSGTLVTNNVSSTRNLGITAPSANTIIFDGGSLLVTTNVEQYFGSLTSDAARFNMGFETSFTPDLYFEGLDTTCLIHAIADVSDNGRTATLPCQTQPTYFFLSKDVLNVTWNKYLGIQAGNSSSSIWVGHGFLDFSSPSNTIRMWGTSPTYGSTTLVLMSFASTTIGSVLQMTNSAGGCRLLFLDTLNQFVNEPCPSSVTGTIY